MDAVEVALAGVSEPERACLERVIALARVEAPNAVAGVSYGMPVLKVDGKPLIGVTASAGHLSVHPFSPAAITLVRSGLEGFSVSKGTVRFTPASPLPEHVVKQLVQARLAEIYGFSE